MNDHAGAVGRPRGVAPQDTLGARAGHALGVHGEQVAERLRPLVPAVQQQPGLFRPVRVAVPALSVRERQRLRLGLADRRPPTAWSGRPRWLRPGRRPRCCPRSRSGVPCGSATGGDVGDVGPVRGPRRTPRRSRRTRRRRPRRAGFRLGCNPGGPEYSQPPGRGEQRPGLSGGDVQHHRPPGAARRRLRVDDGGPVRRDRRRPGRRGRRSTAPPRRYSLLIA